MSWKVFQNTKGTDKKMFQMLCGDFILECFHIYVNRQSEYFPICQHFYIAKALEGATQGLDLIRTYNAKDC